MVAQPCPKEPFSKKKQTKKNSNTITSFWGFLSQERNAQCLIPNLPWSAGTVLAQHRFWKHRCCDPPSVAFQSDLAACPASAHGSHPEGSCSNQDYSHIVSIIFLWLSCGQGKRGGRGRQIREKEKQDVKFSLWGGSWQKCNGQLPLAHTCRHWKSESTGSPAMGWTKRFPQMRFYSPSCKQEVHNLSPPSFFGFGGCFFFFFGLSNLLLITPVRRK